MRYLFIGLSGALLAVPAAAVACTPAPGWPGDVVVDAGAVARQMVRAATSVELAVVTKTEPEFDIFTKAEEKNVAQASSETEKAYWRKIYAEERAGWTDGRRATYKVVERLAGHGTQEFTLNAQRPPVPPGAPESDILLHKVQLKDLPYYFNYVDLADKESGGDCLLPVFATTGATFLIFRDAEGKLLYEPVTAELRGEPVSANGPAYVPVSGEGDPWLLVVREAAAERTRSARTRLTAMVATLLVGAVLATIILQRRAGRRA